MPLKEIYDQNRNSVLFDDLIYIKDLKKKLIDNFDLNPKVLKNNESVKHFDQSLLNNLTYTFNHSDSKIHFNKNEYNDFSALYLKNGNLINAENINQKELFVTVLNTNAELAEKKIKTYENAFLDDYVVNLNSVLMNSGYDFVLEKDTSNKIIISNQIDLNNITVYAKNFFTVKENSKLTIIEKFFNDVKSNSNIINYFQVEENAEVTHLIIQDNNIGSNLQLSSHINCLKNSKYKQVIINTSKSSIRNHHYVNLNGDNAKAELWGGFFGCGNQILDNKTVINHFKPSCSSDQKYKGVLTDQAKASYLSKTYVDKKAQKTEAYQLSKGILLSENSYFHSKPELKIYADDVKCSHGSTIGPFDQNLLFYFRSRGIPENTATSMLIDSFFSDILSDIDDSIYLSLVHKSINDWLKKIMI